MIPGNTTTRNGLFDYGSIHWQLLREQKRVLLGHIKELESKKTKLTLILALTGILHLIDFVQDSAVDSGVATSIEVFGKAYE